MTHVILRRVWDSWDDIWIEVVMIILCLPIVIMLAVATFAFAIMSFSDPLFLFALFVVLCFDSVFAILYTMSVHDIIQELR